jgi:hypothetical protein
LLGFKREGKVEKHATRPKGQCETIVEFKSDEAKQWEGWGTALKPAHEPMVLARKPWSALSPPMC